MREGLQYALGVTVLVLAIGGAILGSRLHVENSQPEAVVVGQEVKVTSGPGTQYVTEFTLPNGAEVRLLENRGNWARLEMAGNTLQGWVPDSAVEAIN